MQTVAKQPQQKTQGPGYDRAMHAFFDHEDPTPRTMAPPPFNPTASSVAGTGDSQPDGWGQQVEPGAEFNPLSRDGGGKEKEGKKEGNTTESQEKSSGEKKDKHRPSTSITIWSEKWTPESALNRNPFKKGLGFKLTSINASMMLVPTPASKEKKEKNPISGIKGNISVNKAIKGSLSDAFSTSFLSFDPFSGEKLPLFGGAIKIEGPKVKLGENGLKGSPLAFSSSVKVDKKMLEMNPGTFEAALLNYISPNITDLIRSGHYSLSLSLKAQFGLDSSEVKILRDLKVNERELIEKSLKRDLIQKKIATDFKEYKKSFQEVRGKWMQSIEGSQNITGARRAEKLREMKALLSNVNGTDDQFIRLLKTAPNDEIRQGLVHLRKTGQEIKKLDAEALELSSEITRLNKTITKRFAKLRTKWGKFVAQKTVKKASKIVSKSIPVVGLVMDLYDLATAIKHYENIGNANGRDAGLFDEAHERAPGGVAEGNLKSPPETPGTSKEAGKNSRGSGGNGETGDAHTTPEKEPAPEKEKPKPEGNTDMAGEEKEKSVEEKKEGKLETRDPENEKEAVLKHATAETLQAIKDKPPVRNFLEQINQLNGIAFSEDHLQRMLQILGEATSEEVDLILKSGVKSKEKLSADDFLKSLEIKLKQVRGEFPEFPERDGEDLDHASVRPEIFDETKIGPKESHPATFSFSFNGSLQGLKVGSQKAGRISVLFTSPEGQPIHRTIKGLDVQILEVGQDYIILSPIDPILFYEQDKKFGFTSNKKIKVFKDNINRK